MSASPRQGSSAYTIVLAGLSAVIVGAVLLTFIVYPMTNAFTGSAMWSADTAAGARLLMSIGGIWEFWGGILLFSLLSFIWVRTRQ